MAKKKPAPTDWETIEKEYRAAQISVNEVARQHGITPQSIRMRAKREGWVRDLSEQVREQVRASLVTDAVTPSVTPSNARETIEAAGLRGAEVVRSHRKDISTQRARVERIGSLLDRLAARMEAKTESDLNDGALAQAVDAASRASASLSQSLHRLVGLERQAFSLDEPGQGDTSSHLSADQARRMAQEMAANGTAE